MAFRQNVADRSGVPFPTSHSIFTRVNVAVHAVTAFWAAAKTSRADVVPAGCLSTLDSEVHPSRIHSPQTFLRQVGVALRDAELLERFCPPCTRDCEGFHVEIQDFTRDYHSRLLRQHPTATIYEEAAQAYRGMRALRTPLGSEGAEAPVPKQQLNEGTSRFRQ